MQSTQPATTIELVDSIRRDSADHAIHGITKYLPKSPSLHVGATHLLYVTALMIGL